MWRHVADLHVWIGSVPLIMNTPFKPVVRNHRKEDRAKKA